MTETTRLCTPLHPLTWLFYMFTSEVGRCNWMQYEGYSHSMLHQPGPKSDDSTKIVTHTVVGLRIGNVKG